MSNQVAFNLAELASWNDARKYAQILSAGPIVVGGGVLPEIDGPTQPTASGIYIPTWEGGPGAFEEPQAVVNGWKLWWLHFRFRDGFSGMNVGLVISKFKSYPNSPTYVLTALAAEAAGQ